MDFEGQKANDYIFQQLMENKSIMIAKFGTVELGVVGAFEIKHNYGIVSYFGII